MLSRVAESLYWSARYVERAENVTRFLDVNVQALLDAQVTDRAEAWQRLLAALGTEDLFSEHFGEPSAVNVADWLLWHEENPSAVEKCVTLARENARSVREQISTEMWEAINTLFLLVRGATRTAVSREPRSFFEQLRTGSHLIQGAADATMTRGAPYEFIQLGLNLERAETTVRAVASRYPVAWGLPEDDPARTRELGALLQSCSAFENFITHHGLRFDPVTVAELLIRSTDFPRSTLACLRECLGAVSRISGTDGAQHRVFGRLCADLEFGELTDVSGPTVRRRLDGLLAGLHGAAEAVVRAYFSSHALPFATLAAQEAQQQQCG